MTAERNPLIACGPQAQQEQKDVAEADLRERVLEREVRPRLPDRSEEDPEQDQHQRPPERVRVIRSRDCPRAIRPASENGSATPTRNENDGWIRSCSEQPTHSTCVW